MSLSKYLAKFHGERIDALRAVREAIKKVKSGNANIHVGTDLGTVIFGDKAVKLRGEGNISARINDPNYFTDTSRARYAKQFKRRGFLESILHDNGLAPKTHLIETQNKKYMVQPKADFVGLDFVRGDKRKQVQDWIDQGGNQFLTPGANPKSLDAQQAAAARSIKKRAGELGMSNRDMYYGNVGWFDGEPKLFDAGEEFLERAMTPAERKSALEKFISYGRRKK